jgi:hypothetical protein
MSEQINEMTIVEIRDKYGLSAPEGNGLVKSLEKMGLIKIIGERAPKGGGKGRKSKVYGIPAEISLKL